jgi:hypothetical protein
MDPWRIGLTVMTAIFVAFIVFRLRPRMPEEGTEEAEEELTRGEQRLWKRLQKLPRDGQDRLYRRLGQLVEPWDEPSDEE